jgi:epoxyqueuosine reductase QueG
MNKTCALCASDRLITFHHLIPRTCHRNKWFRKQFSRTEMQQRGIFMCRRCHSFIHQQFSEKELVGNLNTLVSLLASDVVIRYVAWAKKQH